jgi:membrane-bound lytic murein transglycosylase D
MRRVAVALATAFLCACATPGDIENGGRVSSTPLAAPSAPAAGAVGAIAAPSTASATPTPDPVADVIRTLEAPTFEPQVVAIPREPKLVLPPPRPGNLWERIRRGFAMPDLETKLAANRTEWYANQPEYLDRMAQRSRRYLFHIVEEIERRHMPTELALLPFVESAFQPEAISSAKAAGLWQFIPSTGRIYELEQTMWQDERRDVVESTRAALDYLQKLYDQFGDWHLALAAYNWGEGAVSRAIEKNRRARKPTAYTALRMPRETAYYVPKLQAIKNIVSEPERYGVALPRIDDAPYFVVVHKTRDMDVQTAARLAEMPIEDFRALNPGFNRPIIVGAGGAKLLLPPDNADRFHANLAAWEATGQPLASWTTYKLAANETLAGVALRVGISEQQLREANSVPPRYRLAPGSTILIPRDETMEDDISAASLDGSYSLVPEHANLRKVTYRVRRGDTLFSVARRWKVEQKDIIGWNNLTQPTLFAGQRLELTVQAPTRRAAASKGKAAAKPTPKATPKSVSPAQAKTPVRVSTAR